MYILSILFTNDLYHKFCQFTALNLRDFNHEKIRTIKKRLVHEVIFWVVKTFAILFAMQGLKTKENIDDQKRSRHTCTGHYRSIKC